MADPLKEIREEFVRQALEESQRNEAEETPEKIKKAQSKFMNGIVGRDYIHSRDKEQWKKDSDKWQEKSIFTFLPGYATGDRYTALLTMLVVKNLNLCICYQESYENQKKHAEEAYMEIQNALEKVNLLKDRVILAESSVDLRKAKDTLNEDSTRQKIKLLDSSSSEVWKNFSNVQKTYLYHISVTTTLMARYWDSKGGLGATATISKEFRALLDRILPNEDRQSIDELVSALKGEFNPRDYVALWIANRPSPNVREAEAISNPYMFEVIQKRLEESNTKVFYIADGFSTKIRLPGGSNFSRYPWWNAKPIEKNVRYPTAYSWKVDHTCDVGRFWEESSVKDSGRLGQWYFVYKLMDALQVKSIVGIRSGALEPLALLGINVIYLEHKTMYTPERHACWQGRIPYHRLITQRTTGYLNLHTEETLYRKKINLLSLLVNPMKLDGGKREDDLAKMRTTQTEIAQISEEIIKSVLLETEQALLLKMVISKRTAIEATGKEKLE